MPSTRPSRSHEAAHVQARAHQDLGRFEHPPAHRPLGQLPGGRQQHVPLAGPGCGAPTPAVVIHRTSSGTRTSVAPAARTSRRGSPGAGAPGPPSPPGLEDVQVAALGYARPSRGTFGQVVPLDDRDALEWLAQGLSGRQPGDAGPDDHGVRGERWRMGDGPVERRRGVMVQSLVSWRIRGSG